MEGYRLIFSTLRDRTHNGKPICEWLIDEAKKLEIDGVTVVNASEGYGRDKAVHSAGFFELADQPVEIIMLASTEKCDKLFEKIREEKLSIFYAKQQAEFGFTL
jgi:PII-like signaling protein